MRINVEIGSRLMGIFQRYELPASDMDTAQLKAVSHEELTSAINTFVFHHGPGLGVSGWGDNLQSLKDGGVDSVWRARVGGSDVKFGFQVKSWGDIAANKDSLRSVVLSQISESRQMDLACLFIALAADLTSKSQSQKARQVMAEIERMKDGYAYAVSPAKMLGMWRWTKRTNLPALEQNRRSGYATLGLVIDSLGNRADSSAALGSYSSTSPSSTVRVGDTLDFTAITDVEESSPVEFSFAVQRAGGCFEERQEWGAAAHWSWRISAEDIGKGVFVKVATRRPKGYYQFRDADDYVSFRYDVMP